MQAFVYMRQNDNQNAVKYLKKFESNAKQIQQRAYKLLGDAYGDLGQNKDALEYYKKAAHHFEADSRVQQKHSQWLLTLLRMVKDQKEAIALYTRDQEKIPKHKGGSRGRQIPGKAGRL